MRMTARIAGLSIVLLGLCACNPTANNAAEGNLPGSTPANEAQPAPATNVIANVRLPDDRTPLSEPKGPIDPKSAEAAGQVVQQYGGLIEQGKFAEAKALWGDAPAAARFRSDLAGYSQVHMEIGKPGDTEGAAGSIYTTVPTVFYGKLKSGGAFRRGASVILRRVNDVPGSSAAQRRWHIERIEWGASA
jgi:hypothetical protein